jgi:hypothetical protein
MLREYGLYENVEMKFSDAAIMQVIELAERVRTILEKSKTWVAPEPMQIAGINMPEGQVLPYTKEPQTIPSVSEVLVQLDGEGGAEALKSTICPLISGQF